jgi:hypothetical protein
MQIANAHRAPFTKRGKELVNPDENFLTFALSGQFGARESSDRPLVL